MRKQKTTAIWLAIILTILGTSTIIVNAQKFDNKQVIVETVV